MARGGGGASRKGTTGSSSKAPMPPATTTTTTDYEVPASQPSFAALEPIPEDTSVKRGENSRDDNNNNNRNIQNNFSTASAVASSDDDPEAGAARSVVSETPALLAGDETSPDRRRRHGRRGGATSSSSTKQVCTTRVKIYSAMVILLVVAVGIGIYFIVAQTSSSEDGDTNRSAPQVSISNNPPSAAPMMATTEDDNIIGTFPPFDLGLLDDDLLSNAPSAAPTYNPADMAAMRAVLGQFSDPKALDREGTPQQRAFQWLTSGDRQELKAGVATDVEIRQRYALCVLFYSMAGEEWRDPQFLGPDSHECEWTGIACQRREVAYLDLHEMGLIGRLPSELTLLTGLNALRLYGNLISGELPSDIWDLPLIWADFSENFLTGDVPIPSGRSSVENLYLYDNDFTGTLPYFPNSMDVWASQNSFEDWDRRYATSNTLEHFAMYKNLIEKQLPSTWTAENLVYLDFGINQLTGTIPNSLWGLPKLESLVLHENQLSGTLPTAATKSIQHVWIQSNSLSGLIPASFGLQWSSLDTLLLYDNSLSGQIGQDHCSAWAASMNQLEVDCTVECLCCTTECYPEDFDFGGGAVDEGATDDNTVTIFPVVRRYSNKGYFLRGADDSHP